MRRDDEFIEKMNAHVGTCLICGEIFFCSEAEEILRKYYPESLINPLPGTLPEA